MYRVKAGVVVLFVASCGAVGNPQPDYHALSFGGPCVHSSDCITTTNDPWQQGATEGAYCLRDDISGIARCGIVSVSNGVVAVDVGNGHLQQCVTGQQTVRYIAGADACGYSVVP